MMADLARIKRNVAKMAGQGAPEADIDGYIKSEGVTVEDVRNYRGAEAGVPANGVPPAASGDGFRERVRQAAVTQGINQPMQQPPSPEGNPEASVLPGPLGQAADTFNAFSHGAQDSALLNMGDELYAGASAPFRAGYEALNGRGFDLGKAFQEGLGRGEDRARNLEALNPDAYGKGGMVGTIGLMGRGGPRPIPPLTGNLVKRAATTSGLMGATMGAGEPGSIQDRVKNAAIGGGTGALTGAVAGRLIGQFTKGAPQAVPTVKDLFAGGDAAFKAARSSGAVLSQTSAQKTVAGLRQILMDEGAITPSGKVADLPKINHALNLADDYAASNITFEQLLRIRKQLGKAAGSTDKDERTLAMSLIKKLDEDVAAMTPADFAAGAQAAPKAVREWETGRTLWHTAKKAETVEELTNSAVRQSRKAAAVPVEQATRNKFASFTERPKNLRGYSAKEVQALKAVSEGSAIGNTAKQIGRLAPTTLGGLGVKAGIPFAVGSTVGGPIMGGAAAGVSVGLGYAGKIISGLSTANRARLASIVIRNGGQLPKRIPQTLPPELQKALGNLIAMGGAQSGTLAANLAQTILAPQAASK